MNLPTLGVGLGFRSRYRSDVFLHRRHVDFLEITADHYFDAPPEKREELRLLTNHFPIIPHGLDLSIASAEGLDQTYLNRLAEIVALVRPPWWSEHLAVTKAGGLAIGHLSPPSFCQAGLEAVLTNIAVARRRIREPLLLENISYICPSPGSDLDEADFLSAVVELGDCGLLLDVTNVFANAVNHGFEPVAYLDRIPLDRVVQLHFVGGHWQDGVFVDSHSSPTPPEIWELLDAVLARCPVKAVILERDENLPPFQEIAAELDRVRRIGRKYGRWT